jgi:hypothetical protein
MGSEVDNQYAANVLALERMPPRHQIRTRSEMKGRDRECRRQRIKRRLVIVRVFKTCICLRIDGYRYLRSGGFQQVEMVSLTVKWEMTALT